MRPHSPVVRHISWLPCMAVAALPWLGCGRSGSGGPEGHRELKLAHVLNDKHPVHEAMSRMAKLVEDATKGKLTIHLRHSGSLGGEDELIEKVQTGGIQITKVSSNALEANVGDMGVFTLPWLFRSEEHYWKVLEGEIGAEILQKLESIGLKGLAYYDAGARSFYSKTEIRGLDDLKGLKVRVQKSRTMQETMQALGAVPVGIPFEELSLALEKGERVAAAENNPPSYWTENHYKACPYYFLDKHSRAPDVLFMNLKAWNSLSEAERDALMVAARKSAEYQRELWRQEVERIYRELEAKGVSITHEVDVAPFVEAVKPLYEQLDPERRAWVDRIRAVR